MGHQRFFLTSILSASIAFVGCDSKMESSSQQASTSVQTASSTHSSVAAPATAAVFFDDFNYPDLAAFHNNGWKVRRNLTHF